MSGTTLQIIDKRRRRFADISRIVGVGAAEMGSDARTGEYSALFITFARPVSRELSRQLATLRARRKWRIAFPDGTTATFYGFLLGYDRRTAEARFDVRAPITWNYRDLTWAPRLTPGGATND